MKTVFVILVLLWAAIASAQPDTLHVLWSREGAGDSSLYGQEILALGDQNHDGFNDWAVFSRGWGPPGQLSEPKVEFFHGGTNPSPEPYLVRTTQVPEEEYIWGAKTLGDLNGDGYVDWAIVVEVASDPRHLDVYKIYFGGPGSHEIPDMTIGPVNGAFLPIGNFNGDNFDDMLFFDYGGNYSAIFYGEIQWIRFRNGIGMPI
jgi:hypothetical protein